MAGKSGYLYSPDSNQNETPSDVSPVIDYVKPERRIGESQEKYNERVSNPQFLSKDEKEDRVVEFYAAWCGHCQHYKPKYIQIARNVNKVRRLAFYAVPCPIHGKICKDQEIHGYPTVKFFPGGSAEGVVLKHSISARDILIDHLHVDQEEVQSKLSEPNNLRKVKNSMKLVASQKTHSSSNHDVFRDATLSFEYALKSSVFATSDVLDKTQASVLQKWLNLVGKSVPVEMISVKKDAINLKKVDVDETFQSEHSLLQYFSDRTERNWSTNCSKGSSGAGYTCGLWELLHILTIGVVEWNMSSPYERISTNDAADTIRDYIEHFFMCDDCRKNFLSMYDACQFQRCDRLTSDVSDGSRERWRQLPLWLWETHNDVNVRLMEEERKERGLPKASQEEMQSARWPSRSDCAKCWLEGGGWNEDEVYIFLHSHYWRVKGVLNNNGRKSVSDVTRLVYIRMILFLVLSCVTLFFYAQRRKQMSSIRRRKSN